MQRRMPTLRMKKLKLRKVKSFALGHTASQGRSQDEESGLPFTSVIWFRQVSVPSAVDKDLTLALLQGYR